MKHWSLFQENEYTRVLEIQIERNSSQYAYKTALARAAGCQRAFLSQVLKGSVHLLPDHAAGMAQFWGFSDNEAGYFVDLVLLARAGTPVLKKMILKRLKFAREKETNLSERYQKQSGMRLQDETLYYSAWYWSAIHMALTVSELRRPEALAQRLQIPLTVVRACLQKLEEMKLVRKQGTEWVPETANIHLPSESPLNAIHHQNWRLKAVQDSQQGALSAGVHYSAVYSLSKEDFAAIKDQVLAFLDRNRKQVQASREETLACLTLDWFEV